MTDIDSALEGQPTAPASLTGAAGKPAKCRRHRWKEVVRITEDKDVLWETICVRCPAIRDEARSRRGRTAAKRGKRIQHDRIVALGGRNLAGNNVNHDGIGEMFSYESKSGSAFSDRVWRWLNSIPVNASQTKVLIVTEAPGPGRRARSYVVVEYDQWRDLHGELKP